LEQGFKEPNFQSFNYKIDGVYRSALLDMLEDEEMGTFSFDVLHTRALNYSI
jgi:hypothetical protein